MVQRVSHNYINEAIEHSTGMLHSLLSQMCCRGGGGGGALMHISQSKGVLCI